jgi:sterol desaturase/sphingolipid hydroxylase (fatty acid hydroxylase superfamily)
MLAFQVVIALAVRPFFGRPSWADAIVVAAVATYWPLQEWILHKSVLHGKRDDFITRAHERHHQDPLDMRATLLPPLLIAILIPLHVVLWVAFAPTKAIACTGIASLGAAALSYEWIHFLTHAAYRPRTRWFARVKRHHMAHHQRDPQRWFAFVVPRIDDWLGTGDR